MKKSLLLLAAILLNGSLFADASSLLSSKLRSIDRKSEGRSLKDILAQHGGQLKPGISIITADGVLENESSTADSVAKLKRRAVEFKVAQDERLVALQATDTQALLAYIQVAYGHLRSPLIEFITDIIREKQEVVALTTDALRLINEQAGRTGACEVLERVGEYNKVLMAVEDVLARLWLEIKLS